MKKGFFRSVARGFAWFMRSGVFSARWTLESVEITVPRMDPNAPFAPRGDKKQLEEGLDFAPKFDTDGLIPALAMDAATREPLMLAYMNAESLRRTLEIGEAVYWSRSRQEYWHKGATSGHVQKIVEILTDCDQDALILMVEQIGAGACHTGRGSCFYRKVIAVDGGAKLEWSGAEKSFDPDAVYGKH
jgi:phosphoribosyl-AMP cyclohydrolase